MFKSVMFAAVAAFSAIPLAQAGQAVEPIDLSLYDRELAVAPTQMANLGFTHFSEWRDRVTREQLDVALSPLLDRLEAWGPDTITVETISGADCDQLERYGSYYSDAHQSYCRSVEDAATFTGLDRDEANRRMLDILLSGGPGDSPEARRQLAATMLAAGEHYSAVVQWLRLDPGHRVAGDQLSPAMVERIERHAGALSEAMSVGVMLAVRLGHERVWQVDDHSADLLYRRASEGFGTRMREIWNDGPTEGREMYRALMQKVQDDNDIIALLRALNGADAQDLTIRGDFALGLADSDPRGVGQDYANWWQVRNLRMVANIVAAASLNRSQKTLNIVGASHKGYYDAYLDMMHHVELVDTMEFLAE